MRFEMVPVLVAPGLGSKLKTRVALPVPAEFEICSQLFVVLAFHAATEGNRPKTTLSVPPPGPSNRLVVPNVAIKPDCVMVMDWPSKLM